MRSRGKFWAASRWWTGNSGQCGCTTAWRSGCWRVPIARSICWCWNRWTYFCATRNKPDPKVLYWPGKVDEIAEQVKDLEAELVILTIRSPCSGTQSGTSAEMSGNWPYRFNSGYFRLTRPYPWRKLQVELAQLKHLSTRLIRGFTGNLEQQKGGIGLRGPGWITTETDRRLIRVRITQLREKLVKVQQTCLQGRAAPSKAAIPTISLVGYTNAGKSTLFNILAKVMFMRPTNCSQLWTPPYGVWTGMA